jgi:hypothetical protein
MALCDSLRKQAMWIVGEQFEPGKDGLERTWERIERMVLGPRPGSVDYPVDPALREEFEETITEAAIEIGEAAAAGGIHAEYGTDERWAATVFEVTTQDLKGQGINLSELADDDVLSLQFNYDLVRNWLVNATGGLVDSTLTFLDVDREPPGGG